MSQPMPEQPTRRDFLKTSSLAAAGVLAGSLAAGRFAHAQESNTLRVGLVGCGGRGTGAALNALNADKNAKLVALGDAFADRLQGSLESIRREKGDQVAVDADHCFVGFDAYKNVIASCDVVLLATPPHFRPMHLEAAVEAGKHIFCEKPMAVDAPGIRSVLATAQKAKEKNLSIVSGFCWRRHRGVQETMQRVLDGAIGDIVAIRENYLTGTLWHRGRDPQSTEMEFQMRNWYYFTWLSGDHNVEQHIHSLDKAAWAMGNQPPARAFGLGGRQVRTDAKFGDIYDHHAVCYEYPNGVQVFSYTRQMAGCYNDTDDVIMGTKGRAIVLKHRIEGANAWRYDGPNVNMYDAEHVVLFDAIRSGNPVNDGEWMANSTMWAILGRMVNYTGQSLTWEQALASQQSLAPSAYTWDATPPTVPDADGKYPVAMPGITQFV